MRGRYRASISYGLRAVSRRFALRSAATARHAPHRHTAPARVGLRLFGEQRRLAVPAQPLGLEVFALRLTPGHRLHASARLSGERAPSFPNPRFRPERAGLPLAHLGAPRPRTPQSCHSCSSCPLPVLAHTASSRHHLPSAFMSNQRKRNSTGPKAAAMAVAKTTNGIAASQIRISTVVFAEFLRLYAAINRRRGLRASPGSRTSAP